jgi:hypothetical protein
MFAAEMLLDTAASLAISFREKTGATGVIACGIVKVKSGTSLSSAESQVVGILLVDSDHTVVMSSNSVTPARYTSTRNTMWELQTAFRWSNLKASSSRSIGIVTSAQ